MLRFAGAEGVSHASTCASQGNAQFRCERVRASEHAPRGPIRVLERRHGFAEVVERGVRVRVERLRVAPNHPYRYVI